jgi:hypothetical protein
MFKDIGLRFDDTGDGNAFIQLGLRRPVDIECDVAERAGRQIRPEFRLIFSSRE